MEEETGSKKRVHSVTKTTGTPKLITMNAKRDGNGMKNKLSSGGSQVWRESRKSPGDREPCKRHTWNENPTSTGTERKA